MKKIYLILILLSTFLSGCNGCSKSGKINGHGNSNNSSKSFDDDNGSNIIKMKSENGIYKIPIYINDTKMSFIFDTGARTISISATEAMFLYKQGTLKEEDFIGNVNFQDATGAMSEGTIIKLKTVKIGNKVLRDVEASIVHNSTAPLLFGQSALAKFGKVSIDYNRNEITFE